MQHGIRRNHVWPSQPDSQDGTIDGFHLAATRSLEVIGEQIPIHQALTDSDNRSCRAQVKRASVAGSLHNQATNRFPRDRFR